MSLVIYLSLYGVMRRLHLSVAYKCNGWTVLLFGVFPSDLSCVLAWGRSGCINAAQFGCARRRARKLLPDYNQRIHTFQTIYDYFAFLRIFNTNTQNLHQHFKGKLSSHQLSHMHNTRHTTNSNLTLNFLITQKCYLYQINNPCMEQPTKFAKNCTPKFTLKKQIKSHR